MGHFTLVRNPVTNWTNGSTITTTELNKFETQLAQAINGDDGGCWAPVSAINLGGVGLFLTAPLRVTRGGSLTSVAGSSQAFQCLDSDYPLLAAAHAGRTRLVQFPCALARKLPIPHAWKVRLEDYGLQAFSPTLDNSDGNGPQPVSALVLFRAHDTSTVSKVTVNFRVGAAHSSLPTDMPKARVMRADAFGNVVQLTSETAGADALGYVAVPKPTTPEAWWQSGAPQTLAVPCDQNNVVDLSQYAYYVELVDERGATIATKSPCRVVARTGNIALSAFGPIDGASLVDGDRVLVTSQADTRQNGIYVAHIGSWTRATDLQSAKDFSPSILVGIRTGTQYAGTTFQVAPNITSWTPDSTPLIFIAHTVGTQAAGAGTVFQSILVQFDNISDARWE